MIEPPGEAGRRANCPTTMAENAEHGCAAERKK
jgi:hypothetical protein